MTFDAPGAKVNALNRETMEQLDRIVQELISKPVAAVVFYSAKPDHFIAGADIRELGNISSPEEARRLSRWGQKLFSEIAALEAPTLALIHGACLGGGCELALACQFRIASDHPRTQIGLPEVRLGIIPGWGGTQRLPRLIGAREALGMICAGRAASATQAQRIGLVDEVVPQPLLKAAVAKYLSVPPVRREFRFQNHLPGRAILCALARKQLRTETRGLLAAPLRAIEAVERGLGAGIERGWEIEAELFSELAAADTCKNLIRVFFFREGAKKVPLPVAPPARSVARVGVLGCGVMGAGIAQWLSARGLEVRLRDLKPEFVAAGWQRIASGYRESVQRRKLTEVEARRGMARITATTDWSGFSRCDLFLEAILEEETIKRETLAELERHAMPDAVFATNTSAIPISRLAQSLKFPSRLIGLHFFNPVHKMPLVEIVVGEQSSSSAVATGWELVRRIGKIPVVVKDRPGFLVNRILIPCLNEACWLAMEGNRIEALDRALMDFGLPMGALWLVDEVGMDVGYYVAKELAAAYGERMRVAPILEKLHTLGLKGRKGGKGFYLYADGKKRGVNPEIDVALRAAAAATPQRTATPEEIIRRCVGIMINEAARCLQEAVVASADDVDRAMVMGTGFAPFRGGLLKYADSLGAPRILQVLQQLEKEVGPRFAPSEFLLELAAKNGKFIP